MGLLLAGVARAQDTVRLDASACAPCPTRLLRTLPPAWREYWHFVHLCPVTDSQGHVALTVMTPRLDLAAVAATQTREVILGFFSRQGLIAPKSLYLVDSHNALIGELPVRFPLDPPDRVALDFSDWRDGFPNRVEARRGGAAPVILRWDARQHWFRPQAVN